jgi:hypothetical protein
MEWKSKMEGAQEEEEKKYLDRERLRDITEEKQE